MYWIRIHWCFKKRHKPLINLIPLKAFLPLRWQNLQTEKPGALLGWWHDLVKPVKLGLGYRVEKEFKDLENCFEVLCLQICMF